MFKFATVLLSVLGVLAAPASAASSKTYHFFSKETSSQTYDPSGHPIANTNAPPPVGSYFISTDNDYVGNHKKHAKKAFATDHIICTFTSIDTTMFSFTAICDAQLALPGGMLIADHQTVTFGNSAVVPINSGTGKFAKIKSGQVLSKFYNQNSSNSDLTVTIKR